MFVIITRFLPSFPLDSNGMGVEERIVGDNISRRTKQDHLDYRRRFVLCAEK